MTRIVAGVAGGRRLVVPAGGSTRPTSDRVREALFSSLTTMVPLEGAGVLDLYAGSGALGLEALSRGAAWCLFVEQDARALRTLATNVASVGLPGAQVRRGDVASVLRRSRPPQPAQLALLDPPYATPAPQMSVVLGLLLHGEWLAAHAVVVLERSSRDEPPAWPAGLTVVRDRRYSETRLWYLRRSGPQGRPDLT